MSPNGFNPFELVEDLKKSGFQQKQAEVLAKLLSNVGSQNAVTKQDLEVTKLELKRDIKELESRMKLHMIITSGSFAFLVLTGMVSLAKLGLLTPAP